MEDKDFKAMNINEKKEKLINKEISISDLNSNEVEKIKKYIEEDLTLKKQELDSLNEKIKEMKNIVDNWKS